MCVLGGEEELFLCGELAAKQICTRIATGDHDGHTLSGELGEIVVDNSHIRHVAADLKCQV